MLRDIFDGTKQPARRTVSAPSAQCVQRIRRRFKRGIADRCHHTKMIPQHGARLTIVAPYTSAARYAEIAPLMPLDFFHPQAWTSNYFLLR